MNTSDNVSGSSDSEMAPYRYISFVPTGFKNPSSMDRDEVCRYLGELGDIQKWLSVIGLELLNKQSMTWLEVNRLLDHAFTLWSHVSNNRAVNALCVDVLRKSIYSLIQDISSKQSELEKMESSERNRIYHAWIHAILRRLHHHEGFGIGSRACSDDDSRALLEQFVRVAQLLKFSSLLNDIAFHRFPGEPVAVKWYVREHKNWVD